MSQNLIELRNQKTKLLLDAQKILTKQGVTAEERSSAQKILADVELIESQISLEERIAKDTAERAEQEQRAARPPRGQVGVSNDPLENVEIRKQESGKALRDFLVTGKVTQTEQRDLGVGPVAGSITGGSQLVAPAFFPELTQAQLAYGGVVNIVKQRTTDTGPSMKVSLVNDTGNGLQTWGEDTAAPTNVDPSFSTVTNTTTMYNTGAILITLEELQDSAFSLDEFIGNAFGQRLYRGLAKNISQGDSSGAYTSYWSGATLGATSASPTAVTCTDILNLYNSIDPSMLGSSTFVFHSGVRGILLSLLDGSNRPLFQPALSAPNGADALGTLLGRPVVLDQFAPSTLAATSKTIAFGSFSDGFVLRNVGQFAIARDPYTYLISKGAVAFLGYGRGGSFSTNAGTSPIKYLQQHS